MNATKRAPTDPREIAAKKWGKTFGYSGRVGGWIYNKHGAPVAQGWLGLYFKYSRAIRAFSDLSNDEQARAALAPIEI